jgi:N-acetyl-gamma-glutamylphosphate reductase
LGKTTRICKINNIDHRKVPDVFQSGSWKDVTPESHAQPKVRGHRGTSVTSALKTEKDIDAEDVSAASQRMYRLSRTLHVSLQQIYSQQAAWGRLELPTLAAVTAA